MSQLATRPSAGAITVVENRPLVSAILITRNRESHLRECLCGLMEQSVSDRMEVIVVDEGSDQCESAVVVDLQRRHQNLVYLRIPVAGAGGTGINMAVKIASGKYLTVLEATDRLKRDAYEQLATALEANPSAMLVYGDTCFTAIAHESFANHTSYGKVIWPDYTSQQLTQLSEIAPHPLWRRELHDSVGFFQQGYQNQGMREFLLRVVERFRIAHIEDFTGLKLIAAGGQLNQEVPVQQQYQAPVQQPEAAPSAGPFTAAAPFAGADPDQAYAEILPMVKNGDQLQATQALERHLSRFPEHAVAHNDLGAVCYQSGDKERAIRHYREAVRLTPQESVYLKNLADMLYVETGETDEAIAIYLKLLKNSPKDTETLLNLGIISEGVGQPDEAESFYQRVLEIEPWNQAARQRLTTLRSSASAPDDGEDDEPAEERYERAQALVEQGNLPGATGELERILDLFPDFAPAHNDLAVIYYQNGDKDAALAHYEKAAALRPGNSTFQKNLADFYFVEGYDIDGAIAIYLELLRKEPKNIETLMNLGKICTVLERPQEAETFYGKVTQLEPWNRDARECLSTLRKCANG